MALAARTKEAEAAKRGNRAEKRPKERKGASRRPKAGVKREACMTQSIHIIHNSNIYYNYYNIHNIYSSGKGAKRPWIAVVIFMETRSLSRAPESSFGYVGS
jgi:hypothetical protein